MLPSRFSRSFLSMLALSTIFVTPGAQADEIRKDAPDLIVAISVDQFSADLFAEYRSEFTGGLKRLQQGAIFPAGYQSHAATETCPGHSTILTGNRPARTGIIANYWIDLNAKREDKTIYCAEDEEVPGSSSREYQVSDRHLKVPTLGEWMKQANPHSRVVSIAGKDRSAVMMGGHKVDEIWWWNGKKFASYQDRPTPAAVTRANAQTAEIIAQPSKALPLPAFCQSHSRAITVGEGKTVGNGQFERAAGDARAFRANPAFDDAVLSLSTEMIRDMELGRHGVTDIIAIGAAATDYIGHSFGTSGSETCIQMFSLDQKLGELFTALDESGLDYLVMLTADHGGHDLPERNVQHAITEATRTGTDLAPEAVGKIVAAELGLLEPVIYGADLGEIMIDKKLSAEQHFAVKKRAMEIYRNHPLVALVMGREEILATPAPENSPESWTLAERIRASFDPERSGDFYIALKPRVTPIPNPESGYIARHGSIWDYDRRVPILFWQKGMARFEQPLPVETVDIAPTLAAIIGLDLPEGTFDGRCLDLDAGPENSCE